MATGNFGAQATPTRNSTGESDPRRAANRRSSRVVIDIPVTLSGENSQHKTFQEKAKTLTVSAHGALVSLKTEIDLQKPVIITNPKTHMEIQCRVAHRKDIGSGELEFGLEFSNPNPKFWGIHFPPEDWNPAERKIPSSSLISAGNPAKGTK